jgi:hypothetical protein
VFLVSVYYIVRSVRSVRHVRVLPRPIKDGRKLTSATACTVRVKSAYDAYCADGAL